MEARRVPENRSKLLRNRLIRCFVLIISLTGFATHSLLISVEFFDYSTVAQLTVDADDAEYSEFVFLCFDLTDILDFGRLNQTSVVEETIESVLTTLSVAQLFEFTPQPEKEDLIEECVFRPDTLRLDQGTRKECNEIFNVTRFLNGQKMCYRFEETLDREINNSACYGATFLRRICHMVRLNEMFDRANNIEVYMFDDVFAYRDRELTSVLPLRWHGNQSDYSMILASVSYNYVHLLEPPYDTMCYDRDESEYEDCLKECLVDKYVTAFDRLPPFITYDEPGSKKLFFVSNQTDHTTIKLASTFNEKCQSICYFIPCEDGLAKTTASVSRVNEWQTVSYAFVSPSEPDIIVTTRPSMSFVDYFSFVAGCFGTWFGISFMSLNQMSFVIPIGRKNK